MVAQKRRRGPKARGLSNITIRLGEAAIAQIERLAEADRRSRSSMIELLVEDGLARRLQAQAEPAST